MRLSYGCAVMAFEPYFINASELSDFLYCKRAWHLARRGAPSALAAERKRGAEYHEWHSETVHAPTVRTAAIAGWFAALAFIVFALWLLWALR